MNELVGRRVHHHGITGTVVAVTATAVLIEPNDEPGAILVIARPKEAR